jgi:hypothetical protein
MITAIRVGDILNVHPVAIPQEDTIIYRISHGMDIVTEKHYVDTLAITGLICFIDNYEKLRTITKVKVTYVAERFIRAIPVYERHTFGQRT